MCINRVGTQNIPTLPGYGPTSWGGRMNLGSRDGRVVKMAAHEQT